MIRRIHLDKMTKDDAQALLEEYSNPQLRAGGCDRDRADFIYGEVFPKLREACAKYGIDQPWWLREDEAAEA